MNSFNLNVCKNRGNSRVWIEGNRLIDMGLNNGATYEKFYGDGGIVLLFHSGDGAKSKVAGTATRPIIDICNRSVTKIMRDALQYSVTHGTKGNSVSLLIEPVKG